MKTAILRTESSEAAMVRTALLYRSFGSLTYTHQCDSRQRKQWQVQPWSSTWSIGAIGAIILHTGPCGLHPRTHTFFFSLFMFG